MTRDNEFWRYSLQVYAQPGVAELALNWQNHDDVNVNVLLWCSWLESQGVALTESLLDSALSGIEAWDARLIKPLRSIRQLLVADSTQADCLPAIHSAMPSVGEWAEQSLKKQLLAAELDAEQSLQAWLYECLVAYLATPESSQPSLGEYENVAMYLGRMLKGSEAAEISGKAKRWKKLCTASEAP